MRVRARKDANHTEIVSVFRKCGATVMDTSQLGNGAVDIVIGYAGVNVLVELKDGSKPPSARKLTPDEQEFHSGWKGRIAIIESVDDALSLITKIGTRIG